MGKATDTALGENQEKKKAAGLDDAKKAPQAAKLPASKDKATKEKAPQKKDANKPQDTNLGEADLEAEASQAGWGRRRRRRRWMHSPRERGQKRAVRVRVERIHKARIRAERSAKHRIRVERSAKE